MTANTVNTAFPDFDTSCRKLNQSLQEAAGCCVGTGNAPQAFPLFVGFPVVAQIEVINREEIVSILHPVIGIQSFGALTRSMFSAIAVALGVTDWMGQTGAGEKGIFGDREGRKQSRAFCVSRDHMIQTPKNQAKRDEAL